MWEEGCILRSWDLVFLFLILFTSHLTNAVFSKVGSALLLDKTMRYCREIQEIVAVDSFSLRRKCRLKFIYNPFVFVWIALLVPHSREETQVVYNATMENKILLAVKNIWKIFGTSGENITGSVKYLGQAGKCCAIVGMSNAGLGKEEDPHWTNLLPATSRSECLGNISWLPAKLLYFPMLHYSEYTKYSTCACRLSGRTSSWSIYYLFSQITYNHIWHLPWKSERGNFLVCTQPSWGLSTVMLFLLSLL